MIDTSVAGDPTAVRATADWVRYRLGDALTDVTSSLATALTASGDVWQGSSAAAYRDLVTAMREVAHTLRRATLDVAALLDAWADRLELSRRRMAELRGQAEAGGLMLTPTAIHPSAPWPAPGEPPRPPLEGLYDRLGSERFDEVGALHAWVERHTRGVGSLDRVELALAGLRERLRGQLPPGAADHPALRGEAWTEHAIEAGQLVGLPLPFRETPQGGHVLEPFAVGTVPGGPVRGTAALVKGLSGAVHDMVVHDADPVEELVVAGTSQLATMAGRGAAIPGARVLGGVAGGLLAELVRRSYVSDRDRRNQRVRQLDPRFLDSRGALRAPAAPERRRTEPRPSA